MTLSTDRLIHLVLDGEASPAERRELQRLAAADPAVARREAEARRLVAALDQLPRKHPPEGLVAAVMANIPQVSASGEDAGKLPRTSRVFGATTADTGNDPRPADHHRPHVPAATRGSFGMSEQSNHKRTLVIGAGVLAVAVAAAIGTGVLPVGQNTSGTIMPAQRFIAPQNTAVDVNSAARTKGNEPINPSTAGSAAGAAEAGARGAAEAGARGAAEAGARGAAEAGARGAAEAGARGAAEAGARGAAEAGARGAAEAGARGAAEAGARGAAEAGARGAAEAGARGAAEAGARGAAEAGARGAAEAGARGAAEAGARGAAEAGARGAAEAGARGAAEAGARGAAEAGARGAAEAGARGAAEAGAKGAAQAGAK